jgi:hypothetical protein
MFAKLFITAVVITIAWFAVRNRWRELDGDGTRRPDAARDRPPLIPREAVRTAAYALVALMVAGSGFYLFQDWEHRRQVIEVQVVNPATGAVDTYQARRGDIDGRSFTTIDGRRIRIADMERLVLDERR